MKPMGRTTGFSRRAAEYIESVRGVYSTETLSTYTSNLIVMDRDVATMKLEPRLELRL